jgi:hypothetical protein
MIQDPKALIDDVVSAVAAVGFKPLGSKIEHETATSAAPAPCFAEPSLATRVLAYSHSRLYESFAGYEDGARSSAVLPRRGCPHQRLPPTCRALPVDLAGPAGKWLRCGRRDI